ncbi:Polyisoprenyl-teichoic acid--peptidoglycan teichoic acid transferase TagU [Paenibacillus auburnensis]|uniref:Polyisoprenyl-teichoic acid--peptidoglycan teichoic acid transferase TagU n=1 Tax=Paenibacillus auburnensis TaxID=2905649 RepID=A0ABN8G0X5_9BACL|nr:LCP family protein [Paenibacillus auburnensis]CAH1196254.1 Polyisoprenyl-teichoic acid--peptidoglycan teichoic acid transferase TagU [Paenibacillus auburnensis]
MNTSKGSLPPRSNGQQGSRGSQNRTAPQGKPNKKKVKKRGIFARFVRLLLVLVLIAVLAALGYAGYLYFKFEKGGFGVDQSVESGQLASSKPLTLLLLGTDNRPKHPSNLTDVIMVATLNPETKSATVVSLPRDTYVELSGYKKTKINAFYARFKAKEKSSGILAEDEMKTMMSKYLDIDVDYVTVLDFQGFRDIVDELGGVDVNISADMCYTDSVDGTDINLKKGLAELNGDDALDYVRYRKSNCSPKTEASDDFDRNKRQNEVLNALVGQMQSLGGVLKIGKVLDAVDNNLKTDIENAQIKSMIATYWKISKENIEFVPVTGTWRSPYVYINDEELENAKKSLHNRITGGAADGAAAAETP